MIETTVSFGPDGHLIGTFAMPVAPAADADVLVLMTNAGVISRIGPHRINVLLAQRLANRGVGSLRWDASGLGDSRRPSRATAPSIDQFVADTRAAMDEAQRRYGIRRFVLIGLCSGAEVAYAAAPRDERLAGLVLFDLFVHPTWKTYAIWLARRIGKHGVLRSLLRASRWMTTPFRKRGILTRDDYDDQTKLPSREAFARQLLALRSRGTRTLLLHSGEAEWYNYERQFVDAFAHYGLPRAVEHAFLRTCDHVFTTAHAQQAFLDTVDAWLLMCFGQRRDDQRVDQARQLTAVIECANEPNKVSSA